MNLLAPWRELKIERPRWGTRRYHGMAWVIPLSGKGWKVKFSDLGQDGVYPIEYYCASGYIKIVTWS